MMSVPLPKHAMTENAEILACSKSVGQMHFARLDSIKLSVNAKKAIEETHMIDVDNMNASSTRIVATRSNVKMKNVWTHVPVQNLLIVHHVTTKAFAFASQITLETHME